MASEGRHLPTDRARAVEVQLRERADFHRARAEQLMVPATALGCCRVCGEFVRSGESLAMTGGRLIHGDCAPADSR